MTLMQLRYFCEIAKTMNFTEAARNLFVAQSSVSSAIKDLESELNLPLFIRHGKRNIELTSYGKTLYPYVQKGLDAIDSGFELLRKSGENGEVHIGCFVNTTHNLTPWFLKGFNLENVNVVLDVRQTYVDFFPMLRNGEYDLVITTNDTQEEGCLSEKIAYQQIMLLVPSSSKYAFRSSITIEELRDETICMVAPNSYMDLHVKNMFKLHDITPKIVYSQDYPTLATDVYLGKGIALITKMPVDNQLLSFVYVDDPLSKRAVYISWPGNRSLSESASSVLNHILSISQSSGPESLVF